MLKTIGYCAAITAVLGFFIILACQAKTGAATIHEEAVPELVSQLELFGSLICFAGSLASWVIGIYVWSLLPKATLRFVVLIPLVLFGFLWGWLYLLFALPAFSRQHLDSSRSWPAT